MSRWHAISGRVSGPSRDFPKSRSNGSETKSKTRGGIEMISSAAHLWQSVVAALLTLVFKMVDSAKLRPSSLLDSVPDLGCPWAKNERMSSCSPAATTVHDGADMPGFRVTISQSGSYRLAGS